MLHPARRGTGLHTPAEDSPAKRAACLSARISRGTTANSLPPPPTSVLELESIRSSSDKGLDISTCLGSTSSARLWSVGYGTRRPSLYATQEPRPAGSSGLPRWRSAASPAGAPPAPFAARSFHPLRSKDSLLRSETRETFHFAVGNSCCDIFSGTVGARRFVAAFNLVGTDPTQRPPAVAGTPPPLPDGSKPSRLQRSLAARISPAPPSAGLAICCSHS